MVEQSAAIALTLGRAHDLGRIKIAKLAEFQKSLQNVAHHLVQLPTFTAQLTWLVM